MKCLKISLRRRIAFVSLMHLLFVAWISSPCCAADFTWLGGVSENWGNAGNWNLGLIAPTSGVNTDVFMSGSGGTSKLANFGGTNADWDIDSLTFNAAATGSWNLTGGKLTVDSFIANNDGSTHSFTNDSVEVGSITPLTISANSGNLDFNTNVHFTLNNGQITANGGNSIFFDGGITGEGFITDARLTVGGGTFVRIGASSTILNDIAIFDGTLQINSSSNLSTNADVNLVNVAGVTFDLNGFNTNIRRLTGSRSVLTGGGTLTVGDSADFSFDGVISETGGLTKDSSGVFTLFGVNTYSGATNITGGTLRLGTGGSLSAATDMSISSGATFDLNGISDTVDSIAGAGTILLGGATLTVDETAGTRTFSGNIQESGTLTKTNGGTLALTGTNNTMTNLQINGGIVQINNAGAFGSATSIANATLQTTATLTSSVPMSITSTGSTVNVNNATTFTQSGAISGAGALNKQGNGTLVLGANNSYTGDTNILDGNLRLGSSDRISNSSDVTLVAGATLELNNFSDTVASLSGTGGSVTTGGTSGRLLVNAASGTFTWNGNISGSGGFTKNGNHTMVISAAQSYSGSTAINDGLLQFSGSGSFSAASDISVASGATWDLNGVSDTVDSISGAGNITLGGATLSVDENGGTREFSGIISEAGSFGKAGTHTLTLSGNNTFSGELSLSGGTLSVANSSNLGSATNPIIFFGGTLRSTGSFTNTRSVIIGPSNSGTFDVNTSTTLTQSGTISGDSATLLTKTGGGTLRLTAANAATFSGDIFINDGTLDMAGPGDALGDLTTVTVNSPGIFLVNDPEDIGGLAGSGSVVLNQLLNVGHENTSTTFSGVISGTAQFGKRGTGVMSLSGANTYTGLTSITGGTLRMIGANRLSSSSSVNVTAGATFDLNNSSTAINALTGNGSVTIGSAISSKTLTVGSDGGGGTFSGNITGTLGNLVKTGAGTQVLSGNNTYTGTTSFNGGILSTGSSANLGSGQLNFNGGTWRVTGSLSNSRNVSIGLGSSGTIDVNAGVTLTQTGTIAGTLATLNKTDTGTLLLTASATPATMNINGGILRFSGSGSLASNTNVNVASGATWDLNGVDDTVATIAGAGAIQLNSFAELTVGSNSGATTFSGNISGNGLFIKDGDHRLTLSGANTYSAGTRINGGVLAISSDGNLGNAGSPVLMDGGTLETANSMTINRNFLLNAEGGTIALEGGLNLTTIPGIIDGPGTLTKSGGAGLGALVLSGNNTYSGGTIVETGTLTVSANANLGANSGGVTLRNGSVLNSTGTFTNQHAIALDGGGGITVAGSQTLTQAVGISGTGTLTKSGAGTLLLIAPATQVGDTIINAGMLQFGSGELPDLFDVTVAGGATWDLNGVSDTIDGLVGAGTVLLGGGTLTVGDGDGDGNFSGSIQEAGGFTKTGGGTQTLSGVNTYTAATTINGGTLEITDNSSLGSLSATLAINDARLLTTSTFTTGRTTTISGNAEIEPAPGTTLTFTSPIGGNGDLIKPGSGTLELTASNTYTGLTEIYAGTLRLTGGGLLADSSSVSVEAGATFDLTNINDAIDSLIGAGDVLLGTGTLTIGANDGGGTFSGTISGTGLAGAIVKQGTGTAIFSGPNAYAGGTSINGGVLQIGLDVNLGAPGGQVFFNTGTLRTTGDITTVREMSLAAGGGTIDVLASTTLDAGGNISGAGALTKIGDGTLKLGGISSYASTNIFGGVLSASFNNNLGTALGPLNISGGTLRTTNVFTTSRLTTIGSGGATFDVESVTLTHNGIIQGNAGANAFTKIGAGTMQLTGVNTFVAPIQLNAGTLQVGLSNQLGNAANIISFGGGALATTGTFVNPRPMQLNPGGGTINVLGGTTLTQSGVIGDGTLGLPGPLAKTGSGTLLLTASNTFSSAVNIQGGILRLSGAGRLPDTADVSVTVPAVFDLNNISDAINALSGNGDVLLGSGTLTIGANDGGATFSGVISGSGGLTKIGLGTQLLRTKMVGMDTFANTYAGGTAINGGILDVEENNNLGAPTAALSFNGGTLRASGDSSINSSRLVTLNAGGGTISTVGEDATVTFAGVISGGGSLTKTGLGRLTLSAANNYSGDTVINGGLIRLDGAGRLPDNSTVFVNVASQGGGGAAQGLQLNNISDAINGLNGTGEVDLGSGTLTVGSAGAGGSFTGFIEGTGGFVKTGAGTQILGGNNTYSGGTALNGGVLQIAANNHLGNVAGGLSFNGGTLRTTSSFSTARTTTLNVGGGTFDTASATILTHTTQIGGTGGLGKAGAGTLLISGVGTYGGATTITDGTLRINASERLPNTTSVTVNSPGVFDLNNNNETIDGLSGSGSVQLGTAQLNVGISDGSGNFSGVISGTGDFQKEGTGTQTLSGQNTYSGATVVNDGELILNGGGSIDQATLSVGFNNGSNGTTTVSGVGTTWNLAGNLLVGVEGAGRLNIDNAATVTVGGQVALGTGAGSGSLFLSGGTLDNSTGTGLLVLNGIVGGSGTILANIVNQDTLAPGNSAGILNVTGTYVQETTGVFAAEVGGTGGGQFDVLNVSSTASLAGDLELSLLGYTPSPADTFAILTAGSLVGSFGNVNNGARLNISSGGTGSFQVNYGPSSPFGANQVVLSDFLGVGGGIPGDFDNDGDVDGRDFLIWQRGNSPIPLSSGDLADWQSNYGTGSLVATNVSVPEPSTWTLLWLAAMGYDFKRRRRIPQ